MEVEQVLEVTKVESVVFLEKEYSANSSQDNIMKINNIISIYFTPQKRIKKANADLKG